jgi:hypothetical protein
MKIFYCTVIVLCVWVACVIGCSEIMQAKRQANRQKEIEANQKQIDSSFQASVSLTNLDAKHSTPEDLWTSGSIVLLPTNIVHLDVPVINRTAFEMEAFQWPTNQLLFSLRNNGTNIIEITYSGDVIYDTNKVKEATRIFWEELSAIIREHYNSMRAFDERVK